MPDTAPDPRDRNVEELFDALVQAPPCRSHEDIALRTGWTLERVARVLGYVRRPDVVALWGFTVPHQARGTGEHLYRVVLTDEPETYTDEELRAQRRGARSTLRLMATEGENEANALRALARQVSARARKRLNRTAAAFQGAAAMAADAADLLTDDEGA